MKPRHALAFVVLVFWQVLPLERQEPSGRYRLALGAGAAIYPAAYEYDGCNGRVVDTAQATYTSLGAQLDGWPASQVRLSGFGGLSAIHLSQGGGGVQQTGFFLGFQAAWEAPFVGVGAGYAGANDSVGGSGLSAYLRLGDVNGIHLRADLLAPTPTWGVTGTSRVGIARNEGMGRRNSWFFGVSRVLGRAHLNGPPGDGVALFGDFAFRMNFRNDLLLRGHVGDGVFGLGVGARYNFGP